MLRKKKRNETPASRTLPTGQPAKSPVFSYYSNRAEREVSAAQGRGNTKLPADSPHHHYLKQIPGIAALLAILVSLGYCVTLDTRPKVALPQGGSSIFLQELAVYEQAAGQILSGSWSSHSKLTIDVQMVRSAMKAQFPELEDVSVTLPLISRRPILSITAADPSVLLTSNDGTYVLDEYGRAILAASEVSSPAMTDLPLLRDESGLDIAVGKSVLPKQTIDYIRTVLAQLGAKGITSETLTLPTLANELHLRVKGQPYYVKFNTVDDPLQAAGTFLAVKEQLEREGQIPQEYIDVRIEERTYYK